MRHPTPLKTKDNGIQCSGMEEIEVTGRLERWGNDYGVRITQADFDRLGAKTRTELRLRVVGIAPRIDLSRLRTFESGTSDTSRRHDRVFADAVAAEHGLPAKRSRR